MEKALFWRRHLDETENAIAEKLLTKLWRISSPASFSSGKKAAYYNYYWKLIHDQQLLDDENTTLRESSTKSDDVISLIDDFFRHQGDATLKAIRDNIRNFPPDWVEDTGPETVDKIVRFAIQMWLFVKPDLQDENLTLKQSVQKTLKKNSRASDSRLLLDFSAQKLVKRAGIRLIWTTDISQHLMFESRSVVLVFSRASVLEQFEQSSIKDYYPSEFLLELRRTLNLLWDIGEPKVVDKVQSLEQQWAIDIEARVGKFEKFNLQTYPFFGERLAKIQDRLEHQDERRSDKRGIRIAIWALVFTALFGLISAATGLVQMWASLQSLKSGATPQSSSETPTPTLSSS